MVYRINATFNNISVILWWSVLLEEETRVPGENHRPVTDKLYHIMLYHRPVASHWQTLSHNVVSITPLHEQGSEEVWVYCVDEKIPRQNQFEKDIHVYQNVRKQFLTKKISQFLFLAVEDILVLYPPLQDKKKNIHSFPEKIYSYLFITVQTLFSSIKPRFYYVSIF